LPIAPMTPLTSPVLERFEVLDVSALLALDGLERFSTFPPALEDTELPPVLESTELPPLLHTKQGVRLSPAQCWAQGRLQACPRHPYMDPRALL
jgi:hypothetical protein